LTTFLLACAGLILLSGVFFLFGPRRRGPSEEDLDRANLDWFLQRRTEIEREEGAAALEEDAQLRLLEEEHVAPAVQKDASASFPVWLLLPLVALAAAGLYYYLGAAEDVLIAQRLNSLSGESTPDQMRELIATVEARSAARPDNLHYLALLGRYYMGAQDYVRAAQTYNTLVAAAPEDAQVLAYSAQAEFLAAGRTLTDRARLRAEQALAVDPHQRTALGMLGMNAFDQEQYEAAIDYWQRLLAVEPPGSETHRMLADVIATARQRLGQAPDPGEAPMAGPDVSMSAGVTVRVDAPEGATISATDTVFVLARDAESGSRMPIAVQRLSAAQLPITLRLDNSNSMAGQKLSEAASVVVAVQVSADGRPGEANASWLGEAGPLMPSNEEAPVLIRLQANPGSGAGSN
jgi:cytochrome c-type biogenesis protein CcmH